MTFEPAGIHPMWFLGLLITIIVILVVVWAVRASSPGGPPAAAPPSGPAGGPPAVPPTATAHEAPVDILKRRLAAGDITPDEFERMRKLLE